MLRAEKYQVFFRKAFICVIVLQMAYLKLLFVILVLCDVLLSLGVNGLQILIQKKPTDIYCRYEGKRIWNFSYLIIFFGT